MKHLMTKDNLLKILNKTTEYQLSIVNKYFWCTQEKNKKSENE